MNLGQLRTEVNAHGFSGIDARINQWLNDANGKISRRVGYFTEEATQDFSTVQGTSTYPWPADLARLRSVRDTTRYLDLQPVLLDDIDQSSASTGAPYAYALDASSFHLYPTPDGVYSLEARYWKLPSPMVLDSDVPALPADWHDTLIYWALRRAYMAEDDLQSAQVWETAYNSELAKLSADVKFPSTDGPTQVRGMWDQGTGLSRPGWW